MLINGHTTSCTRIMYLKRKKRKEKKRYILSSLHPSKHINTPPNKNGPILTLPLRMTTFISKTTSPFCHEWQRVRVSNRHLIGRASISISIIRSIIVITIIIILILRSRSHGRRWWRSSLKSKPTYGRLSSCNTTDTNVHLIQLRKECIEASIHAL